MYINWQTDEDSTEKGYHHAEKKTQDLVQIYFALVFNPFTFLDEEL